MTADERRSARLLFADALDAGTVTAADLERPEVARAVHSANVPSLPSRLLQRRAMKRGRLTFAGDVAGPFGEARRAVLGDGAQAPPRLLIRIDEFPHWRSWDLPDRYGTEAYERFHKIMREAGVPYLVAVTPRIPREGIDPEQTAWREHDEGEREMLRALRADGVAFGVHGLDHRTRHTSSRRHSELLGLAPDVLRERLDLGQAVMRDAALDARVFVAPYNRFSAGQYPILAERFDVVTGGPESVPLMGWHRTPLWRGDAVYLPAYAPLYGTAADAMPEIERLDARAGALWLPVVLHWGWEADEGWENLRRLAEAAAPYAAHWQDFLDTVERTRDKP
jgi:peptidoglycan/xylan/chitin deacetylase (PgdA/CDA1 family)